MNWKPCVSLVVLCIASVLSTASWAQDQTFVIVDGGVTITSVFCPPEACQTRSEALTGSFTAQVSDDEILFTRSNLITELEPFTLPKNPNEDSGGTVRDIEYSFDGTSLVVWGVINQSAFDGPIIEYEFSATVTTAEVQADYYYARMDFRKCASPMCGGVYLSKVNQRAMRCPNGEKARTCYIGLPDWSAVGGNPFEGDEPLLLAGKVSQAKWDTFEEFGAISVNEVYRSSSKPRRRQTVVSVVNNGLVCITSPCFSYDLTVVNRDKTRALSMVDLSRARATKAEIEQANALLANGQSILATGYLRRTKEFSGPGLKFVAKNLFLPVETKPIGLPCPAGYADTFAGCATPHGCFFPELEQETIGGTAMIDPVTGEQIAQISYSCVKTCEPPAELIRPGLCLLALP